MGYSRLRGIIGFIAAGALVVSSTGAVAATSLPAPPQISPWAVLAGLSGGAPAAAVCGTAAAAAAVQGAPNCVLPVVDAAPVAQAAPPPPVPVPPAEPAGGGLGIDPLYLALGAVAVGVGLYFLLRNKDNGNSPG